MIAPHRLHHRSAADRIALSGAAAHRAGGFWSLHREAALNWLAFGLLLAAWNGSDNDVASAPPRPQALRGYPQVSVRAAQRAMAGDTLP
jgi:hypothetical protein